MLALTGCTIGGSFYMLNFSLTPNAKILSKDADSYPFMYRNYPFLRPWVDSLKQVDALKDTFIINPHGIQLHAYYVAAPQPTSKTAVIVHGHTDNAIRMFMIGYLYNRDLGYNILLPDLQHQGESEGPAIQMGWKDRWDVLQWMNIANEIFGDSTQMVVHHLLNALWKIAATPVYGTNSHMSLKLVSTFPLFHSCIPQAGFARRNMDGILKRLPH